ncbi:hypothetical protein CCACVL1_25428 [Corchorus capsularis]|uniref:Uncharacterized protein n=1 Tax=Corchorus capsularis TaxID=210143 RepID=A0A1R3GKG8_COCAP|nr:hypothetical protein CCACVL1_25428 [Corchorus capsularis]
MIGNEEINIEAVVFGNVAQKLTGFELTKMTLIKGVDNDKLPDTPKKIYDEEYSFTVGINDQSSDRRLLSYKIYAFTIIEHATSPKGKVPIASASNEIEEFVEKCQETPQGQIQLSTQMFAS